MASKHGIGSPGGILFYHIKKNEDLEFEKIIKKYATFNDEMLVSR